MTFRIPALWLLVVLCEAPCLCDATAEQVQNSETNQQGSVLAGKALFTGAKRFRNRGPACAVCHRLNGLGFPNGGSLGPDLTGVAAKLGPDGLDAALETLYFPTMAPIFDSRPLTPLEQQDLKAFFVQAQAGTRAQGNTGVLVGIAFGGCAVLLALTWVAARRRPEPVRQSLVRRSAGTAKVSL